MIILGDLWAVFIWLALLFVLHISLLPILRAYVPQVSVPLSCSIGVLLFTLVSFYTALFNLPIFCSLIPFFFIIGLFGYRGLANRKEGFVRIWWSDSSSEWRYYALFGLVFFSMLILRVYSPDISSAEKFMDHGFIASMMRMPIIPPLDPWFSGGDLSVYYYMGHWMLAALGLIAGIPSPVLFTLALPTIAALAAVNLYGAGHMLLSRFRLLPVVFFFLMNPAFVSLALSGTDWGKLLWDSTRVIDATINEYPLFSFIFGDVHAHILGIFPQTTLILLFTFALTQWMAISNQGRCVIIFSTGLALGAVPPTNSWDILIQAPLVILTGLILLFGSCSNSAADIFSKGVRVSDLVKCLSPLKKEVRDYGWGHFAPLQGAALYIFLVPIIGIVCFFPFYLMMKAQGIEGIGLVLSPSSVESFILVNGWFIAIIALSLLPTIRKNPWLLLIVIPFIYAGYYAAAIGVILLIGLIVRHEGPSDLLAGVACAILVFCEIFYLQDGMGEQYFRMNTVFKLYLTAWLLFSVGSGYMGGKLLLSLTDRIPRLLRFISSGIPIILFLLLLLPAYVTITHSGPHTPTFDGLAWLSMNNADDRAGVMYLRSIDGNYSLVEAEGGDYGYYSRVSSFTGIPTIIGWPFHERMWRGDTPSGWYAERTSAVRSIYEDPVQCVPLMKKYGVDFLYVGPTEELRYSVNLPTSGLKPVFRHGAVTIYGYN